MTREELRALGVTDEQIDKIMASHAKDIQTANAKAEKYKADADKAAEYKAELDKINEQSLTDIEKANKATETANSKIAELEKQIERSNQIAQLSAMGITGEQAEKLVGDNGIDYAVLSQIISDRESKAAIAKEQEIASKGGNPSGGAGGSGGKEPTTAEKLAKQLYGKADDSNTDSVLSHYLNN